MNNTLVIVKDNNAIISTLFNEKRAIEINYEYSNGILNNIYVGKVKNILKNINSAFIEIADGIICYYKIDENPNPIFTKQQSKNKLCVGDEILVQIMKEPIKTKQPVATSVLSFVSKNVVLTHGNNRVGISGKITNKDKKRLKELGEKYINNDYGLIFRTNSANCENEELEAQIDELIITYQQTIKKAISRTCFSLIYKERPSYITQICGMYDGMLDKIVTDDKEIFECIAEYVNKERPEYIDIISLYEDDMLSLNKLYGIESELKHALAEKVWLKSGAYLVIQPTEALTVIDVNTGKYVGKKNKKETYLNINLEAAKEIAIQLRLRNIAGICIVDFIDMESEDDKQLLLDELKKYVVKDPIKTVVVDITELNLVELTRKRVKRPLIEQIQQKSVD